MTERVNQTKSMIVEKDPQQELWEEGVRQWALDGSINYKELMERYPRYTIDEKVKHLLHSLLPKVF